MRTVTLAFAATAAAIVACTDRPHLTAPGLDPAHLQPPALSVSEAIPAPRVGDRVLFDARTSLQTATTLRQALALFGYSADSRSYWGFTTDYDGAGTNALRVDWPASTGTCARVSPSLSKPLTAPYPLRLYIRWKQRLGRTATGGGLGELNTFQILNPRCNTAGRFLWSMDRDRAVDPEHRRVDLWWQGPNPARSAVEIMRTGTWLRPIASSNFLPQEHVGTVLDQALYMQAESVLGAKDGAVRYWVNGALVIDSAGLAIGADAFKRFSFPWTMVAPPQAQSEYFWDIVLWEPTAAADSIPPPDSLPPPDSIPPADSTPPPTTPIPVATVTVTPATVQVDTGKTTQLAVELKDSTGAVLTNRVVAWTSSDSAVASVSSLGLVRGRKTGSVQVRATSEGKADSSAIVVVLPPPPPVRTVTVTPAEVRLDTGKTVQLVVELKDSTGAVLTGRAVTWASSDGAIASVSTGGLVRGVKGGTAYVRATSEGKADTSAIVVVQPPPPPPPPPPPVGDRTGWYVGPAGRSSGAGTAADPWDLATALAGAGGRVVAGDTIWMLGGVYRGTFRSTLAGQAGLPVVVRQFPGVRATIDGGLRVDGQEVTFWGFEIMQSDPLATPNLPGLEAHAPGGRYVNLVIHDVGQQGITFWTKSGFSEVYGSIIYNAGTEENLDHGIYAPNDAGEKRITDNVFFNNLAYGIHVYGTSSHPVITNVIVEGNASFNTGTISSYGPRKANLTIGGDAPTERVQAISNMLYFTGTAGMNLRLGLSGRDNRDIVVRGNYSAGGALGLLMEDWDQATVESNTFIGGNDMVDLKAPTLTGHRFEQNRYHRDPTAPDWRYGGSSYDLAGWKQRTGLGTTDQGIAQTPTEPKVFVRPNKYEAGRAMVVVYNWSRQSAVAVDVSGVLAVGDRWELRNVQDFYGAPVATGSYQGGTISVPMSGVTPPRATGRPGIPPKTGPEFDTFILLRVP